MIYDDLKYSKFFNFIKFDGKAKFKEAWIGKTVIWIDRGYAEYGIIVGIENNLALVNFANFPNSHRIALDELYFPVVKPNLRSS